MTNYYLDIESTNKDNPETDDIITIQFQELDRLLNPIGELKILKCWESSEEQIVREFYSVFSDFEGKGLFNFVPVMYNKMFDLRYLFAKFGKYNLPIIDFAEFIYRKPVIDLKTTVVIMNNFEFKGAKLSNFSNKVQDGSIIPELYRQKKYEEIEEYIRKEAESFLEMVREIHILLTSKKWK